MKLNDTHILEGLRKGDRLIFELVFKTYYPGLCAYAKDFTKSAGIAEETVQDLFLYVLENHSKIQIKTSLKAYLYRSVHNRCLNYFRDNFPSASKRKHLEELKPQLELISMEIPDTFFDEAFSEQVEYELEQAVESLPEQCRDIFRMSRHENLPYPEIASQLNVSLSTVKTQMSRAMKKLSERMGRYLGKGQRGQRGQR